MAVFVAGYRVRVASFFYMLKSEHPEKYNGDVEWGEKEKNALSRW